MKTVAARPAADKLIVDTYFIGNRRNATKVIYPDGWIVRLPRLVRDRAEAIRLAEAERATWTRPAAKPARTFGAGLLRSLPTYRAPASFEDMAWHAEQAARAEDRRYDERYEEVRAMAAMENGCWL